MKKLILLTPLLLSGCFMAPQGGYQQTYMPPPVYAPQGPSYENFSQRRMEQQDRIAEQNYRRQHIQQLEQQNRYVPVYQQPSWYENR